MGSGFFLFFFFFFQIFPNFSNVAEVVPVHPSDDLARLGYRLDMKVGKRKKKKRILLYSWLPNGTYHETLVFWEIVFRNLANWVFFFFFLSPSKILCVGLNHIFQMEI